MDKFSLKIILNVGFALPIDGLFCYFFLLKQFIDHFHNKSARVESSIQRSQHYPRNVQPSDHYHQEVPRGIKETPTI